MSRSSLLALNNGRNLTASLLASGFIGMEILHFGTSALYVAFDFHLG